MTTQSPATPDPAWRPIDPAEEWTVAEHEPPATPDLAMVALLAERLPHGLPSMMPVHMLTARQVEIIDLLTEPGATQQTVADKLGISVQTVKNHLTMAYRTLGVRSIAQAARAKRKRSPVR